MKIQDFKYKIDDIITTDGYLSFCNDNNICYIKTDFFYTGTLNWRGKIHPEKIERTCVVGHSDYPVVDTISDRFEKLFCINRNTERNNTFGLPLGITNDCDDSLLHQIYGNKDIMIEVMNEEIEKRNLLYMNFNIENFPKERQIMWELFSKQDFTKIGEIHNTITGRRKFLQEIKSSKFVLCPRGNGVDTHRLWETLYMGSIPIVKYENTHHLFTDLPILFIEKWEDINEEFLNKKWREMEEKDWNLDKLKISYWTNFIKNNLKK